MSDILKEEILNIQKQSRAKAKKPVNDILKGYKRSLDSIQGEIGKIALNYQVDGKLNISSKQRYAVLKSLEKQLIEQAKYLGDLNVNKTTELLSEVYELSYYRTAYTIDKGISSILDYSVLRPEMIEKAINYPVENMTYSQRIWKNQKKLVSTVKSDVEKALIQGAAPEKLARQIKKDFGVSAYEAQRLISNEVSRVINQAQDEIYSNSDVVERVLFDATLDNKTSDICQSLDGQYFPKDKHPIIPDETHVSCRSCIIPVVSGWKPTKKLENIVNSETGKKRIIDYITYDEWLESKNIQ